MVNSPKRSICSWISQKETCTCIMFWLSWRSSSEDCEHGEAAVLQFVDLALLHLFGLNARLPNVKVAQTSPCTANQGSVSSADFKTLTSSQLRRWGRTFAAGPEMGWRRWRPRRAARRRTAATKQSWSMAQHKRGAGEQTNVDRKPSLAVRNLP